ncbi:MAG: ATPase [Nitrospirales bacterium]|nr:MAG: ATPase [Nitrospirales bacterium]
MAFFRNTNRLIIILVSLLLLYTLVGFVVIPWVAKSKLPAILSEQLGRTVVVNDITFNPFTLSISVQNFEVQEQDQSPLFGFQELFVNFQVSSIFRQIYTFEHIKLVLPYGLIKIRPDGTLNVAELGPTAASESDSESVEEASQVSNEEEGVPAIEIQRIAIEQGMVEFHDESRPTPFHAHIVPIEISLNNFATHPDLKNPYTITAELSEGEMLEWEGTLVLEPFSSSGKISLTGLRLHTPWRYLQDQLRFEIQNGFLNVSTQYELTTQGETVETILTGGEIHVSKLNMAAKGNADTVLAIPAFDVEGVSVDVAKQHVTIPLVRSKDAVFSTWLNEKGMMNYQELFTPIDATEESEASGPAAELADAPTDGSANEQPWVINIQDFAVQNYAIDFEDRTVEPPAQLNLAGFDLQVKKLMTTFQEPFDVALAFTVNDTGKVDVAGTLGIEPVVTNLDLKVTELGLPPFSPYLSPHVQFQLSDGAIDLDGKLQYQGAPGKSPLLHYSGQVALSQFSASDPELAEEFLKFQSLLLKKLVLDVEPTTVLIEEIELVEPFVKATIADDGSMNFSRLFSPPGASEEPDVPEEESSQSETAEPAQEPLPVKIGRVRLVNAAAQFADLSLEPNVQTGIQELTGTISGLSSAQVAKADIELKGKVDKYAPFEVNGKINPLSKDAYSDLTLLFKNVNLTAVSPYSGKYAGHPITKGKLSLDLKYKVAEHVLEGENKILIDQMTMGAETGSPDATSLPVPLAIALLKDRHGKIDIDLPVRGNLNDPDFSYGGVLIQTLLNLLTKAVTSPFNLVGGLVGGGGDDLQFVEFELGSQELNEKEQEKLNTLASALVERPALRLEVTGTADPAHDRTALAEATLETQLDGLREQKETPMTSDEQRGFIRELFVQTFGEAMAEKLESASDVTQKAESNSEDLPEPKDSNSRVATNSEPTQEPWERMKRQLLDAMDVHESEVRLLAQQRAQAIRDHLIQQGKIPKEQVFLIEVQLNAQADQNLVRSPLSLTAG